MIDTGHYSDTDMGASEPIIITDSPDSQIRPRKKAKMYSPSPMVAKPKAKKGKRKPAARTREDLSQGALSEPEKGGKVRVKRILHDDDDDEEK